MKLHFVHVSNVHHWNDNRIFRRDCRSLARQGHRVTLVAKGEHREEDVDGVEVIAFPSSPSRRRRLLVDLVRVFLLAWRARGDVYHLHDPELALLIPLLRLRGATVVYDSHEDLPLQVTAKSYLPTLLRGTMPILARLFCRGVGHLAHHVVTATSAVRHRFVAERATAVHNYPELVDVHEEQVGTTREPDRVVYVGRVSESRGALTMLDAFERARVPSSWTLVVVGPKASGDLARTMRGHPIAPRVQDLGPLPPLTARETMLGAAVGLAVLHPTPAYVEALPTKLFEYMAAGIPVIASDFPSWRAIVDGAGCGFVVDPTRPDEIARALEEIARDPVRAREMGRRGRRAVFGEYNWSSEERQLFDAYRRARVRAGHPDLAVGRS